VITVLLSGATSQVTLLGPCTISNYFKYTVSYDELQLKL